MSLVARRPSKIRTVVLAYTYAPLRLYSSEATNTHKEHATKPAHLESVLKPARASKESSAGPQGTRVGDTAGQSAAGDWTKVAEPPSSTRNPTGISRLSREIGPSTHPDGLEHSKWQQLRNIRARSPWKWETHTSCFADLSVDDWPRSERRPGITKFLNLRPVKETPGMVFDLQTETLSVDAYFSERLHYVRDAVHHEIKPWIKKAFNMIADSWRQLDREDFTRVRHDHRDKTRNRTRKKHRGHLMGSVPRLFGMAMPASKDKRKYKLFSTRMSDNLGTNLPSRWLGHLDGMQENDAAVYAEFNNDPPKLTSLLFAVNSSFSQAQGTWAALAQGEQAVDSHARRPDVDAFTPLMLNFARWLKHTYKDQEASPKVHNNLSGPEDGPLPLLRDSMSHGSTIPVVFAFRQKYIWFLWKGGIHGCLEAQYASHWLPVWPDEDYDAITWFKQQELLAQNPDKVNRVPNTTDTPRSKKKDMDKFTPSGHDWSDGLASDLPTWSPGREHE